MNDGGIVYCGYRPRSRTGAAIIVLEGSGGERIGFVRHIPRHSPQGMSWGTEGSASADCARSLLADALGEDAHCPDCAGTHRVVFDAGAGRDVPFDPEAHKDANPELVADCNSCDDGFRHMPYQKFKREVVARWGQEWRMSRTEILTWLLGVGLAAR